MSETLTSLKFFFLIHSLEKKRLPKFLISKQQEKGEPVPSCEIVF